MRYELDYTRTAPCLCGQGTLLEHVYSDDWNRSQYGRAIECSECSAKYHFESKYQYHSGREDEIVYLVENGKSINIFFSCRTYYEAVSHHYLYSELQDVLQLLKSITAAKRAEGTPAAYAVKAHKSYNKTVKLPVIIQHVEEALAVYHTLECNKETAMKMQAECDKVEKHQITFSR